jgi:hypothetical protein
MDDFRGPFHQSFQKDSQMVQAQYILDPLKIHEVFYYKKMHSFNGLVASFHKKDLCTDKESCVQA